MQLIYDLLKTSSRVEKEQILKRASRLEMQTFEYAYNPDKLYRLSKLLVCDVPLDIGEPTDEMFDLLDRILKSEIIGNEAKNLVENFLDPSINLIRYICKKDLRCGITATTLNKVFGKQFIHQFKVQLAKTVDLNKIIYPCIAQIKYDGVRMITIKEGDTITFKTRNGKTFEYPHLKEILLKYFTTTDFVLDGELTFNVGQVEDRTSISGLVISAIAGTPIESLNICYNIFDCLELVEFQQQLCYRTYKNRYNYLIDLFDFPVIGEIPIGIAENMEINSESEANEKYGLIVSLGYEGLILKSWDHLYTFKRSKDWVKIKAVKSADLMCMGMVNGKGQFEDQIGALICSGDVEGKWINVNIGSGLTHLDRSYDVDKYLHKTIEVSYNSVIQDSKTGDYSLFLPRFNCVRFDK